MTSNVWTLTEQTRACRKCSQLFTGDVTLSELPGIGKDLAGKIADIVETGHFRLLKFLLTFRLPHRKKEAASRTTPSMASKWAWHASATPRTCAPRLGGLPYLGARPGVPHELG
jgi:hypothetical protein